MAMRLQRWPVEPEVALQRTDLLMGLLGTLRGMS